MDINRIGEIATDDRLSHDQKERQIISVLSQDERVIPIMMEILSQERELKKRLIMDMNFELSRADVHIQLPTLAARDKGHKNEEVKQMEAREFVLNNITAFYHRYKGIVSHCFNKQV